MVKVLIERWIATGCESTYEKISMRTLQNAVGTTGYVSGEVLKDINIPSHRIILCQWKSVDNWEQWYQSNERRQSIAELLPTFERPEKITLFSA